MGKTYKHIPIALPDIFAQIVSEVETNLASESSLDIPQVNFKHGTMLDIAAELVADSKSPEKKLVRYPLVCLIYKADEKFVDEFEPEINVDILICTATQKTYSNDQRYTTNIKPIIYPIYAELKSVISKSKYFWGYKKGFDHTKIDLPHAGQESAQGNVAYELQDVIDGLMMKGLKLKVAVSKCPAPFRNLCLLTPCDFGREAFYVNVFKNVTFTGLGTSRIEASVNDYFYLDSSGGLPAPFAPEIDWGDGSPLASMTVPSPPNLVPFTSGLNVAPLADGFYLGRISFNSSDVQFYYKIASGLVVKLTSLVTMNYEIDLDCALYPDNVVNSDITYTISKVDAESNIINGYEYDLFGVNKVNQSFSAVGTITKVNDYTNDFLGGNFTLSHGVDYGGQAPMLNRLQIKTRCKTSF